MMATARRQIWLLHAVILMTCAFISILLYSLSATSGSARLGGEGQQSVAGRHLADEAAIVDDALLPLRRAETDDPVLPLRRAETDDPVLPLRRAQTDDAGCPWRSRVYVYPFPDELTIDALRLARTINVDPYCKPTTCIHSQFALEQLLHDYLLNSCARVDDPAKADYFFIPLYATIFMRLETASTPTTLQHEATNCVVAALHGSTECWKTVLGMDDQWLRRHGGRDHIIVQAHPPIFKREFFSYEFVWKTNATFVVIETERSKFLAAPESARSRVIVAPYPVLSPAFVDPQGAFHNQYFRPLVAVFVAGMRGPPGVRAAVESAMLRMPSFTLGQLGDGNPMITTRHLNETFETFIRPIRWDLHSFYAVLCPAPVGDTPSTRRLFNALLSGCAPIVISDELVLPWQTPQGQHGDDKLLNWDALLAARVPEASLLGFEKPRFKGPSKLATLVGMDDRKDISANGTVTNAAARARIVEMARVRESFIYRLPVLNNIIGGEQWEQWDVKNLGAFARVWMSIGLNVKPTT